MKRVLRRTGVLVAVLTLLVLGVVASSASAHTTSLTIDPQATLEPGGLGASVSGTVVCTAGHLANIQVQLTQFRHGQVTATGFGNTPQFLCSGITQQWQVTVTTIFNSAPFKRGSASARADSFTDGVDGFDQKTEFADVRLR